MLVKEFHVPRSQCISRQHQQVEEEKSAQEFANTNDWDEYGDVTGLDNTITTVTISEESDDELDITEKYIIED